MWQFIFWFSLGLVVYAYFGYPIALFILTRLKRRYAAPSNSESTPSVALIVSAYNEEQVIQKKIENSIALDYPLEKYRIIIASDGSDDDTVAISKRHADFGVNIFHYPLRAGKSAVLNEVVERLTEDIIVFSDANSLYDEHALRKLVRHFDDPGIGCVVGKLRYTENDATSVARGEGAYWRYEGILSRLESQLRSVLVANGSIFAIRRELFMQLYPEIANDFQTPADVASEGFGIVYEPGAVAYEHSVSLWREEFDRKVRIVLQGYTGFMRIQDRQSRFRKWQLLSRKALRWLAGPILSVTFFANFMLAGTTPFFAITMVLQTLFYGAALVGWRRSLSRRPTPLLYLPFYFAMVNTAAVVALAKFITGQRQTVWEKAESVRFEPAVTGVHVTSGGNGNGAAPTVAAEEEKKVAKT